MFEYKFAHPELKGNERPLASEAFQRCAVSTRTCHLDISAEEDGWGAVQWRTTYQPAL